MKIHALIVSAALLLSAAAFGARPEFFAFDNGVGRGKWTPEQQAKTLKELGYDGISYNYTTPADLAVWLKVFKAQGLKIYGLYVCPKIDQPGSLDAGLRDDIAMLKGSGTVVWINPRAVKKPGVPHDDDVVKVIREFAGYAATNGVDVAIYPHVGTTVSTAADAVRVAKLVDRPNVGTSINLCHEFMSQKAGQLDETVKKAAPLSILASINGVDVAHKKYIRRLDQGDFDLTAYVRKLYAAGYKGPMGLQCYSISGDTKENLARSIAAWRKIETPLP